MRLSGNCNVNRLISFIKHINPHLALLNANHLQTLFLGEFKMEPNRSFSHNLDENFPLFFYLNPVEGVETFLTLAFSLFPRAVHLFFHAVHPSQGKDWR